MTEKFTKIVTRPEKLAKKIRKVAENFSPVDYVKKDNEDGDKGDKKDKYTIAKNNAKLLGLRSAKWSAWLAAGGAQFLLMLMRWSVLDNELMHKMEKKFSDIEIEKNQNGKPKKLQSFAKKYPNMSAHIMWYFMLLSIGGGAFFTNESVKVYKEWHINKEAEEKIKNTYAAFLKKMQPITPFLIADLIAKEGVHIDPVTGLHTPYRDSKGIPTIGFGSTKLKDGKSVTMSTEPITTEEAYELARWHLEEGETYFVLYCYDVALKGVNIKDTEEALGMSSIVYNSYSKLIERKNDKNHKNRFEKLRNLYKEYGYGVPDSLVKKCFDEYPIKSPTSFGKLWLEGSNKELVADKLGGFLAGGRGLYWRRWLEAGLLIGEITPQMLLNCPSNGMYEFFKYMGSNKKAFFTGRANNVKLNKETYEVFRNWLDNPVNKRGQSLNNWKKVKDFLPKDVLAFCEQGKCELGSKNFSKLLTENSDVEVKSYVIGYDELYADAISSFKNQDYKIAAEKFENMLKMYPDNALLHNDLAATYNKIGRYKDAIGQARIILNNIGDKSQYGAAQYNAGFAYEQIGNYEKALDNYKLAVTNGNKRVIADVKRVSAKFKKNNKKKITSFNKASSEISSKEKMHIKIFDMEERS